MKKFIAAIFILSALPVCSYAGDYSSAVDNQRLCDKTQQVAQMAFKFRQDGLTLNDVSAHIPDGASPDSFVYLAVRAAFDEHIDSAYDAGMRAWAQCMDRLNGG